MVTKKLTDEQFIAAWRELGSPTGIAAKYQMQVRGIQSRRRIIEVKYGIKLDATTNYGQSPEFHQQAKVLKSYVAPQRTNWTVRDGEVFIGSDFHLWPEQEGPMLRAFRLFIEERKPKGVILNGDILDFPSISRHPPLGWEKIPTAQEEIEHAQDYLHTIVQSAGRNCQRAWTLGNHDARFEMKLAATAPQFVKVHGIHLHDHFQNWPRAMQVWINDVVVVKHRYKGGIHAAWNNVVHSGKTTVTGHLHSGQVRPFTDLNGTRYGVDCGCIADIYSPQFEYLEGNPRNWVSSFAILTFRKGRLLMPELVTLWSDNEVQFRGKVYKI